MKILLLVQNVEQYGCSMLLGIIMQIQFLIKLLLKAILHHWLIVVQVMQKFVRNIIYKVINFHYQFLLLYLKKILQQVELVMLPLLLDLIMCIMLILILQLHPEKILAQIKQVLLIYILTKHINIHLSLIHSVGNVPFVNAAAASNRYSDYYC